MNNATITTKETALSTICDPIIGSLCLVALILGVLGNAACLLIFQLNSDMRKTSANIYLSYCCIADIVSLFEWNLDHFMQPFFNEYVENPGLANCRLSVFLQYVSLQSSAWLLSFACMDRYFSVVSIPGSFVSRLPFTTMKSAHIWSVLIVLLLSLINLHLVILNGYFDPPVKLNRTIVEEIFNETTTINILIDYQNPDNHCYEYSPNNYFPVVWESIHLFIYCCVPFSIMIVFNSLLIMRMVRQKRANAKFKKSNTSGVNKTTLSLLSISFTFIVMNLPSTIMFGFIKINYSTIEYCVFKFFDFVEFSNRSLIFFNCFITNSKFRSVVLRAFSRRKITQE